MMAVQPFARFGSAASVTKRACLADVYVAAPVSVVFVVSKILERVY